MKTAIFPGSFDPFTRGHWDIACRALKLCSKLYIGVGYNMNKAGLLTPENRVKLIEDCFTDQPNVEVVAYDMLTVELCQKLSVYTLVHGVRSFSDFEYERQIAEVNARINDEIENLFLLAAPGFASVSSSAVRELIYHKADIAAFLPPNIEIQKYL